MWLHKYISRHSSVDFLFQGVDDQYPSYSVLAHLYSRPAFRTTRIKNLRRRPLARRAPPASLSPGKHSRCAIDAVRHLPGQKITGRSKNSNNTATIPRDSRPSFAAHLKHQENGGIGHYDVMRGRNWPLRHVKNQTGSCGVPAGVQCRPLRTRLSRAIKSHHRSTITKHNNNFHETS